MLTQLFRDNKILQLAFCIAMLVYFLPDAHSKTANPSPLSQAENNRALPENPNWTWLKEGRSAEARKLRSSYIGQLGQGLLDEEILSQFTDNGERCFDNQSPTKPKWLQEICQKWLSEPQTVTLKLPHSHLVLTKAHEFKMIYVEHLNHWAADTKVSIEQDQWLLGLFTNLDTQVKQQLRKYAKAT